MSRENPLTSGTLYSQRRGSQIMVRYTATWITYPPQVVRRLVQAHDYAPLGLIWVESCGVV